MTRQVVQRLGALSDRLRRGLLGRRESYVLARSDPRFRRVLPVAMSVDGYTSPVELSFLYHLALHAGRKGTVVEIGSYLGRSTVALAFGAADGGNAPIIAVDPYQGHPEWSDRPMEQIREEFLANLERTGIAPHVQPIRALSTDAARMWNGAPVVLLFLDGLHTHEAVVADVQAWRPLFASEPCVVFDDYLTYPGVRSAVRELMRTGVLSGSAVVAGKMIAFGSPSAIAAAPVAPGGRLLARIGDPILNRLT
jgi:predicted O-methyltransferase YrrM